MGTLEFSSTLASRHIAPVASPVQIGGYVTIHRGRVVAYAASSAACAREAGAALPEHKCDAPIAATAAVIRALLLDEPLESLYVSDGLCRTFSERRRVYADAR